MQLFHSQNEMDLKGNYFLFGPGYSQHIQNLCLIVGQYIDMHLLLFLCKRRLFLHCATFMQNFGLCMAFVSDLHFMLTCQMCPIS